MMPIVFHVACVVVGVLGFLGLAAAAVAGADA